MLPLRFISSKRIHSSLYSFFSLKTSSKLSSRIQIHYFSTSTVNDDLSAKEIFDSFRKGLENKKLHMKAKYSNRIEPNVTIEQVEKMAFLSRIKIEDHEKESVRRDFEAMINLISKVQEVDTKNVEPLYSVLEQVCHSFTFFYIYYI
jgi:hypothetical protein